MVWSPAELEALLRLAFDEACAGSAEARSEVTSGDDPLHKPYTIPDIRGKRVLVVGVGGGCDIISAFALAQLLNDGQPAKLVYANTKSRVLEPLEHLSAHVLKLPPDRIVLSPHAHAHRTTLIDQSVPRGDDGCPFIFLLPDDDDESCDAFVAELRQMAFDVVFSVDTGADSIVTQATSGPDGRDQRMMRLLARLGRPWFHVAVSPGCDGEASVSQIQDAVRTLCSTGSYLGCTPVAPMLPTMRELAAPLRSTRTPNIIVEACSRDLDATSDDELLTVPREIRPEIPRRWLSVALVFDLNAGGLDEPFLATAADGRS